MKVIGRILLIGALSFSAVLISDAQEGSPEPSVMGIELGNRASAEKTLSGYGPTFGTNGLPNYFFYNKFATQVLHLTAASWDDRYLITEIEVYSVGSGYQRKHFQLKDVGFFTTGSGLFIGYKQSATGLLMGFAIGVNDPGGRSQVKSGRVEKLFGEPSERVEDGDDAAFVYDRRDAVLKDIPGSDGYKATYVFHKGKLRSLKFIASGTDKPAAE